MPMSYLDWFQHLLKLRMIELRTMGPPPAKLPLGYDANARCDFHSGEPGHRMENCKALKYKVQDLIDAKAIEFTPRNRPNVVQNLMPPHGSAANSIEEDDSLSPVERVNDVKTLLFVVKEQLISRGEFPGCTLECE